MSIVGVTRKNRIYENYKWQRVLLAIDNLMSGKTLANLNGL
jgi:hypothetical protein|nr:hypothetical protein [uncultured Ruminococcus sp.]